MEAESLKRGVEFSNRLGESGTAKKIGEIFSWWKGRKFNRTSVFFLCLVFAVNFGIVFPLFTRDLSASFSSSALNNIAEGFNFLINRSFFFSFLSVFFLSFLPISIYLFIRKIALGNDLIAFLTTLFFILPLPGVKSELPQVSAIFARDGSHIVAFTLLPIILLFMQMFLSKNTPKWGIITIIGTAVVAVISPFAMFNLLIFYTILTIAEGFMGEFRAKFIKLLFILISSFGLSFFWYYPNVVGKIALISHVQFTLDKLWSLFPLAIPAIPIFALVSFLFFDRREKLKPVFVSVSGFLVYASLFLISKNLGVAGIFTAERYLVELSFTASLLASLILVLFGTTFYKNYILAVENKLVLFSSTFLLTSITVFALISIFLKIQTVQGTFATRQISKESILGIGSIERVFDIANIGSFISSLVSLLTFLFLIFMLKRSSINSLPAAPQAEEGKG